jgi:predicted glycosyltransferase
MRIWIDLGNSPHVNFFAAMIKDLQKQHEVLLTTRPFANTIDLLELHRFKYHVIGRHYGANKVKKLLGFSLRFWQLYRFLRKQHVEAAISHSCFYSPIIARLLGIRSIYLNDNEHAAGNRIAFPWATKIMVPEFLSLDKVRRQWGSPDKTVQYPGVKEGVYLWRLRSFPAEGPSNQRSGAVEIFIRPEPWAAQYYRGATNFMDSLIIGLKDRYKIVVLPRGEQQAVHYRQEKFAGIVIPDGALSLEAILTRCMLFIGAGGTMTREAAVLGIPTVSVYQDQLLDVDRYLIAQERMIHEKNLTAAMVDELVRDMRNVPPSSDLLKKGQTAYELIIMNLLNGSREEQSIVGCPEHRVEAEPVLNGCRASAETPCL